MTQIEHIQIETVDLVSGAYNYQIAKYLTKKKKQKMRLQIVGRCVEKYSTLQPVI